MRNKRKVFELMGETTASIFPLAQDIMGPQFEKHFTKQRFYGPTFLASQIAPKPISVDLMGKRNPYANPAGDEKNLADAAEAGYLDPDGKGGYVVSEKGANAIQTVHDAFYSHLNEVNQHFGNKLEELAALLAKLVDACTKADLSNGCLCLDISRNGHPKVESGSLAHVDQLLDDMNAFRDDAHISAWTPVGVDGHTWEVLGFVWGGETNTVEKLIEQLSYRTYLAEDYTATLNDLAERGWIEPGDDGYVVTKEGKKIRGDGEAITDTNYFAPWKALSDDEITRLGELLSGLKATNLKIMGE